MQLPIETRGYYREYTVKTPDLATGGPAHRVRPFQDAARLLLHR
jgi:guanyl-specific ribonuclease Sa